MLARLYRRSDLRELSEQVETLQNLLIARATGEGGDAVSYQSLRHEIVNNSLLKDIAPRFLRTCRSLGEFWQFIKYEYASYAERRQFIWSAFRLFERIEGSKATPADQTVSVALEKFDSETVHRLWLKAIERRETDPEGRSPWHERFWRASASTSLMSMALPMLRTAICRAFTRWQISRVG